MWRAGRTRNDWPRARNGPLGRHDLMTRPLTETRAAMAGQSIQLATEPDPDRLGGHAGQDARLAGSGPGLGSAGAGRDAAPDRLRRRGDAGPGLGFGRSAERGPDPADVHARPAAGAGAARQG